MFTEKSILTDSIKTVHVYTVEGSTINLTFEMVPEMDINGNFYPDIDFEENKNDNKYDIIPRPDIIELQIKNVTINDTGLFWAYNYGDAESRVKLSITSTCIITCYMFPLCSFCVR